MSEPISREGILVIQPLPGIGDMVWHLPHVLAIAHHEPEGRVSVLTKRRSLSDQLLGDRPEVSEVLWVERKPGRHDGLLGLFRLATELRAKRYRKVWLLHDSSRYLIACWLAGIPLRAGIATGWQRLLLTERPARPVTAAAHTVERANQLLNALGLHIRRPVPLIVPTEDKRVAIRTRFRGLARPWLIVGIGSSEAYKQWGSGNFAELLGALIERHGGTCFLLGGRSEEQMAESIRHSATRQGAVVPLIQQPLQEIVALLADADLFIGNDTGVLNLAAACGVQSIGLFGHPISSWVASSSPCIHPVYPPDGLSSEGVRQIRPELVLNAIKRLGVLE